MNTLDLQAMGLEEMNEMEAIEVEGGWLWIPIAAGMLLYSMDVF